MSAYDPASLLGGLLGQYKQDLHDWSVAVAPSDLASDADYGVAYWLGTAQQPLSDYGHQIGSQLYMNALQQQMMHARGFDMAAQRQQQDSNRMPLLDPLREWNRQQILNMQNIAPAVPLSGDELADAFLERNRTRSDRFWLRVLWIVDRVGYWTIRLAAGVFG